MDINATFTSGLFSLVNPLINQNPQVMRTKFASKSVVIFDFFGSVLDEKFRLDVEIDHRRVESDRHQAEIT